MTDTTTTPATLTAGQRAYADQAVARAADGERTVVAFDGRRTSWTETVDDDGRPVARFTVTDDLGRSITLDEFPPLTAEEQAERNRQEEEEQAARNAEAVARREAELAEELARREAEEAARRQADEDRLSQLVAQRVAEELDRRGVTSG